MKKNETDLEAGAANEKDAVEKIEDKIEDKAEKTTESAEERLQKALDEKDDQFLRLRAEYDNFRKRSQKEKSEIYYSSRAEVVKLLLPVLDDFERAAKNKEASLEDYRKGIELVFEGLKRSLEKEGVSSFGERGDKFDPGVHNAVMVAEDDELGENEVAEVFTKGYKLDDKVIREAVVKVANS